MFITRVSKYVNLHLHVQLYASQKFECRVPDNRGIGDNSKIIFPISQQKHML